MLYFVHEWQRAAAGPLRLAAQGGQLLFRHPFNPLTHTTLGRSAAAALEIFEYASRSRRKPAFGIDRTTIRGEPSRVRTEVALRLTFCDLVHFVREGASRDDPRVLIVAPLSGHYATLLRGTVEELLPDHDVYITDWRNARDVPEETGSFDLDYYIEYVMTFLRLLGPGAHVMAVCQPSVPVLAAVALLAAMGDDSTPRSMVLVGGPIDTRINPTTPNRLAQEHSIAWFETNAICTVPWPHSGRGRRVYPGFLQLSGFMSMNFDRHLNAHWRLFEHLVKGDGESADAHRRFYDEYLAVMDLAAEYYLQTVRTVFQEHALPQGKMAWRGTRIEPRAIETTALMTIEGELDDISGLGQTQAAHALCSALPDSLKVHHHQPRTGHYGIFNGRHWRDEVRPRVAAFIATHR